MSLPRVKKGSSVGRVRMPYSFPQSTLVNYYVGGAGVGAVSTSNRNAMRRRAAWRPVDGGKGSERCSGFCNNNNQYRVCKDIFCTTSTFFTPVDFAAGTNKIFVEESKNHHIEVTSSGTGLGQAGGFDSLLTPFSAQYYAAFKGSTLQDPAIPSLHQSYHTGQQQYVSSQGRYLRTKPIKDLNLPSIKSAENKDIYIKSYSDLVEIKIIWTAGNKLNGADTPDVHEWLTGGYERRPEDLYVEFYDADNKPIGTEQILWKTKREPTASEYATAANLGISAYDFATFGNPLLVYGSTSPFYNSVPLNWNPDGNFWSLATIDTSQLDLRNASFFIIKQRRHTWLLDNYGVKYVELKFKYGCYPN